MKQSTMFVPTLRDVPADAEATSHQLLIRAGFIRQNAAGIYSFLPLGNRVLKKVQTIIQDEMDAAGAQELLMPTIQPAELWHETGRWDIYGPELMRLKDRHGRDFALGPTHEEIITDLMREVNSYKKLPMTLYQIQTKYRDERRPRFGLLRGREFIMKDAYSFDTSKEGLDRNYDIMHDAYQKVFSRCGLNFRAVMADSGAIGGKDTQEFMALADIGEDTIAYSDTSEYASNIEMAEVRVNYEKDKEEPLQLEKTSEDVDLSLDRKINAELFIVDDNPVLVLVRGDHEVNDIKLKNLFDAAIVEPAEADTYNSLLGCSRKFAGPVDAGEEVTVVADHAVEYIINGACGANQDGVFCKNVMPNRDFQVKEYSDLRMIQEGDSTPDGNGKIQFAQGIEIGQIFKLGTRYSEAMDLQFLDENGRSKTMIMGCYGIGVSRTIAAIVEQNSDENGIIWPASVAPFDMHLIAVNMKNSEQRALAQQLYDQLKAPFEVLFDDRKERAGVKFADSDLIGIPLRVIVGKRASEGIVEIKHRKTGETTEATVDNLIDVLKQQLS